MTHELRFETHNYCELQLKDCAVEATIKKYKVSEIYYIKRYIKIHQRHDSVVSASISNYNSCPRIYKHCLSYIKSIYMNDFLRLLQKYNIKLKIKAKMIPQKQRFNDSCIMEDTLITTTSQTDIKRINACRIYLQGTSLSDISNIKGTALIAGSLIGDRSKIAISNLDCPNQRNPNPSTWLLWSLTTKHIYCE